MVYDWCERPPTHCAHQQPALTACRAGPLADFLARRVAATHYTLRHYSSWDTEAVRHWNFQARCLAHASPAAPAC